MKNKNGRSYKILFIIGCIIIFLLVVNRWLANQLHDIESKTAEDKKMQTLATSAEQRIGIPVIDPQNDPLAPVVKIVEPVKKPQEIPPAGQSSAEKVQEPPQTSTILVQ